MNILVCTADKYLARKLYLELTQAGHAVECGREIVGGFDTVFADAAAFGKIKSASVVYLGKVPHGAYLPLPLPLGAATEALTTPTSDFQTDDERKTLVFRDKTVTFTDVEFSLLQALLKRKGALAARDELLAEIWGEGASESVLNVYIHYLREKLEADGEKWIFSARGGGYRIRDDIFGGQKKC